MSIGWSTSLQLLLHHPFLNRCQSTINSWSSSILRFVSLRPAIRFPRFSLFSPIDSFTVKALLDFQGALYPSASSAPVALWVTANPSPPGELPFPTDITYQHFSEDLGVRLSLLSFLFIAADLLTSNLTKRLGRRDSRFFTSFHRFRSLQPTDLASRRSSSSHDNVDQGIHSTNIRIDS